MLLYSIDFIKKAFTIKSLIKTINIFIWVMGKCTYICTHAALFIWQKKKKEEKLVAHKHTKTTELLNIYYLNMCNINV